MKTEFSMLLRFKYQMVITYVEQENDCGKGNIFLFVWWINNAFISLVWDNSIQNAFHFDRCVPIIPRRHAARRQLNYHPVSIVFTNGRQTIPKFCWFSWKELRQQNSAYITSRNLVDIDPINAKNSSHNAHLYFRTYSVLRLIKRLIIWNNRWNLGKNVLVASSVENFGWGYC